MSALIQNCTIDDFDNAIPLDTIISEDLIASADDLVCCWRYFRLNDSTSILKYGTPHGGATQVFLTAAQKIQYSVCFDWFTRYIHEAQILRIETPLGGIFIRKTTEKDNTPHAFVTMDIGMNPGAVVSIITLETVGC